VEFVLIFPLVLVVLLMMIESGFALHSYITVNNAASEAARLGATAALPNGAGACRTDPLDPSVEGRAVDASAGLIECSDVTVTYHKVVTGTGFVRGDGVTVHIRYEYESITPLGELMTTLTMGTLPSTVTMQACSDSRLERTPATQAGLVAGTVCS
jgi:Flp pilus assembly protein TadG